MRNCTAGSPVGAKGCVASASDDSQWRTCPQQQVGDGGTTRTGVTQAGSGANREEVYLFYRVLLICGYGCCFDSFLIF